MKIIDFLSKFYKSLQSSWEYFAADFSLWQKSEFSNFSVSFTWPIKNFVQNPKGLGAWPPPRQFFSKCKGGGVNCPAPDLKNWLFSYKQKSMKMIIFFATDAVFYCRRPISWPKYDENHLQISLGERFSYQVRDKFNFSSRVLKTSKCDQNLLFQGFSSFWHFSSTPPEFTPRVFSMSTNWPTKVDRTQIEVNSRQKSPKLNNP